ncbi:MAG: ribonuclease P protein subunit [Thermoplasmata archaeon]|nr:ribonuclease P protein subunit [Thermoplasmata archaeon]MBU1159080.1 ribonuclease P protein subunit [Candidatus Thermoplasmatota archaeon]MCJ7562865.1 ribonuclease P protein subunit [Thermoplasmata archaeon]TFG70676.1 MAG: ribonuclease P protein subunit [Methanomassiliicoccus sp.]
MKAGDFRRRELIGLEVEIVQATCASYLEIRGKVVDETRNTFVIEHEGAEKVVPKECCEFLFREGSHAFKVSGKDIKFRPEDRIKKVR